MAAFKNKNGTWYVQFRYTDWKGEKQQKLKRGFATKKEAQEWERQFLMQKRADINMTFESFVKLYEKDIRPRLKENTWLSKECIIECKILPYFGSRKLCDITPADVIAWQNEIMKQTTKDGKKLSGCYLKNVHSQLSCIFNHAIRYYGLSSNPASKAGNMGKEEHKGMLFWTLEEYQKFSEAIMDKPMSYYAFEMLYWCGIREGELLALTANDFDLTAGTVTINKSYQRLKRQDVITTPKTPKSNRTITMPKILTEEMQDYLRMFYSSTENERIFPVTNVDYLIERLKTASCDPVAFGKASGVAFEETIADIFSFMGFDAKRIGGSGDTDVIIHWKDDTEQTFTAILDGKSKSSGQVAHTDISDVAIDTHKDKHNADYVAIVGHGFSGDTIKNHAKKKRYALITADELSEIARASKKYALNLKDIALIFKVPDGLSELAELISQKQREIELISKVISKIYKEQDTLGSLSPRDLLLLLREDELSPTLEELIGVFDLLTKPEIGLLRIVNKAPAPQNVTYMIGNGKTTINRLRSLAYAIEKGLYS